MSLRTEKVSHTIQEAAATFLSTVSNRSSLITVTNATVSDDLARATVFISVLPEEKEEQALGFVMRQGTDLRNYLKQNLHLKRIPHIDFSLDYGEKNRQHVDELFRNSE